MKNNSWFNFEFTEEEKAIFEANWQYETEEEKAMFEEIYKELYKELDELKEEFRKYKI